MRWIPVGMATIVVALGWAAGARAATGYLPADKDGFATSTTRSSPVWLTLRHGIANEVYWPDLSTPAVRSLRLTVGGVPESRAGHATGLSDPRSLSYRQTVTDRHGRWRLVKRWTTDPARATVLLRVRYTALDGRARPLGVRLDPALDNGARGDRGGRRAATLVAVDGRAASALRATPRLRDLRPDVVGRGDVVQAARTTLTGRRGHRDLTLALAFGRTPAAARAMAGRSLRAGFARLAARYADGWHRYLRSLKPVPRSARMLRGVYEASVMVLHASEDKRHPGAIVASPTMPWAWGDGHTEDPSGPYHLVWSRDLYQIATAQLAAGDRASARRALRFLFDRQQRPDGSFPQNSEVDGTPHWRKLQMDQVAFPLLLAWQLGRDDARTYRRHIRPAAEVLVRRGPRSQQERWENQSGFSPATIAAQVAGLVCAADIARRNGDMAAATRWLAAADRFNAAVERWTLTTSGPLSLAPYYLRVTKDGQPNRGTTYDIGDSGSAEIDQRAVVDPSFLELVRLGLRRPDDPNVVSTTAVVDATLGAHTANGLFWHRFSSDGYGEHRDGAPWEIGRPGTFRTLGRAWPLLAGERGEAELAGGDAAAAAGRLTAMAATANAGLLLAEQVWDGRPPTGRPGFASGEGTRSAAPLAWTHAQLVRLAWSLDAGAPVETPSIVACRYTGRGC
jgi:glucoamylase